MRPDNSITETVDCLTVDEFLAELSLRNLSYRNPRPGETDWLFRGQSNSEWDLVPSALRPGELGKFLPDRIAHPKNHGEQVRAEQELLLRFIDRSDLAGLPLPDYDTDFRLRLSNLLATSIRGARYHDNQNQWIPRELFGLMALVQHSGLPTRLLDWTSRPEKAAYFAAESAVEKHVADPSQHADSKLSVWAIECRRFGLIRMQPGSMIDSAGRLPLELFPITKSSNDNAWAQEGWFSVWRDALLETGEIDCSGLNVQIRNKIGDANHGVIFRKITISYGFAVELLSTLDLLGICRATVFPDFRGAADAVKSARHYQKDNRF
jgi:hypothetical protein